MQKQKVELSLRLSKIAEHIPYGSKLADIGTDHALLPVALVQDGHIPYAVAGELNDGPYQSACEQVEKASLQTFIQVRQGNGLEVLDPDEVDTVVIAGMGGNLICTILNEGSVQLRTVNRLILQPNVGERYVRQWLVAHGWHLSKEVMVAEGEFIYEILIADRDDEASVKNKILYSEKKHCCGITLKPHSIYQFGPYLLSQPPEQFFKKWRRELAKRNRIVAQMKQSKLADSQRKCMEFEKQIEEWEAILQCLQTVRH